MLEAEVLNVTLRLLAERGEAHADNITAVLAEAHPDIGPEGAGRIVASAGEIVLGVIEMVKQALDNGTSREEVVQAIATRWPDVSEETIDELFTHATLRIIK